MQRLNFLTLNFGESNITYNIRKADAFAERVQTEIGLYVQAKTQWFRAFRPLFERSRSSPGSKEFLSALVLMIHYLSVNVSIRSPGRNLEGYCDAFLEDFITIVDPARNCLETSSCTVSPGKALFMFDDGIVAGLSSLQRAVATVLLGEMQLNYLGDMQDGKGCKYNTPFCLLPNKKPEIPFLYCFIFSLIYSKYLPYEGTFLVFAPETSSNRKLLTPLFEVETAP